MIDNILHFCKENNVEPETLLYHLGRLTYVGRGVLAKKHRAQFLDDDRRRSKKEVEKIQDDYRRLLETIMALSVEELKGGSVKNGESRPSINGSESEHGTAQIGSDRSYPLKGYA
jgi:hypothetical protein